MVACRITSTVLAMSNFRIWHAPEGTLAQGEWDPGCVFIDSSIRQIWVWLSRYHFLRTRGGNSWLYPQI